MSAARAATAPLGACLLIVAVAAVRLGPLLACPSTCFVDFDRMFPTGTYAAHLHAPDVRLNAWTLGWGTHALGSSPTAFFEANAFHPAPRALAGSEHLLGTSLLLVPASLAGAGAVLLHNLALLGCFALTGLTVFALVRWATVSTWAGLGAGLMAVAGPWRVAELSHLQLLSTSWFALVWLLSARILVEGLGRRTGLLLFATVCLQMLSSYYLAYFLLASLAALVVAFAIVERIGIARGTAWTAPIGCALVVLVLVSQPYLDAGIGRTARLEGGLLPDPGMLAALGSVGPMLTGPWSELAVADRPYALPLAWLLVALCAFLPPRRGGTGRRSTVALAVAMGLTAVLAVIMSMGRQATFGALTVDRPASWAAWLLPGFTHLRAPLRWGILVNLAVVVIAGLGLARIGSSGLLRSRAGGALKGAALLVLCLFVSWRPLPTTAAWTELEDHRQAYRSLAGLEPGPVLEIPWPLGDTADASLSSAYMLASTVHWHRTLNGYTAYEPPTYDYLRRVGARLPERQALVDLVELTGLRWVVLHDELLGPSERDAWDDALAAGLVARAWEGAKTRILEVAALGERGVLTGALLAAKPRELTFRGLRRKPLELGRNAGVIEAPLSFAGSLFDERRLSFVLHARVSNRSKTAWPGFDVDERGLVAIRYTLHEAEGGREALAGLSPLDQDVAPGTSVLVPVRLEGWLDPGPYRLTLDLVQQLDGGLRVLPVKRSSSRLLLEPAVGSGAGGASDAEAGAGEPEGNRP